MKRKNGKKKTAIVASSVALLTVLAGTFAWQSYTEWVKNHLQSRGYEEGRVTIVEKFDPETPIDEAVNGEITKEVSVVNTSSTDAFIRVSFEEMLHKLEDTAAGLGYASESAAAFPVIINATEYVTTYTDKTADLVIYDTVGGTSQTVPSNLKLYVSADDTNAVLINERTLKVAELPTDFDYNKASAKMPVLSGSFDADTAVVAQKVTGEVVKDAAGNYVVYQTAASADLALAYWGYGVGLGAKEDADWAGANVNVPNPTALSQGTVTPGVSTTSAIAGSDISFITPNVTTTKPTAGSAPVADWYFDSTDGYFYYTKVLPSGSTTSASMMDAIKFPSATDREDYKLASYNLYVGLESIPAARSAVTAASNNGALIGSVQTEGNKTWVSNGSGWGLTDAQLTAYYESLATVVE
ncbi:hypothetical protein ACYSNU_16765 [Enterococcus sp. LJL120]